MVNIVMDDASFYGLSKSMSDFESSDGNVSLTHLGGMISQLSPVEYIINGVRKRFKKLPNKTKKGSMHAIYTIMQEFGELDRIDKIHDFQNESSAIYDRDSY